MRSCRALVPTSLPDTPREEHHEADVALRLGVDAVSGQIVALTSTDQDDNDESQVGLQLKQVDRTADANRCLRSARWR